MSTELRKQRELVARRVKGLSLAIRLDKFRLAQHLRMGLAASLQHLEGPLRMTLQRVLRNRGGVPTTRGTTRRIRWLAVYGAGHPPNSPAIIRCGLVHAMAR